MQIIVSWATQTSFAIQISVSTEVWNSLKSSEHWHSGSSCCDFVVRGTRQETNEFCSTNELPKLSYVLTHISRNPSLPNCKRSTLLPLLKELKSACVLVGGGERRPLWMEGIALFLDVKRISSELRSLGKKVIILCTRESRGSTGRKPFTKI